MLVTCLITSHNKPDLCHEALQSVVNQTHQDWQGIVWDSGVLYDQGYFNSFSWSADERFTFIRSHETEETRRTKAMAPWCFNECFRNGLVKGEIVLYLCDDDIYYPDAFHTFASYAEAHPDRHAFYASQDVGVIYPNGWRAIVGERRALHMAGKCCGGAQLDCCVDSGMISHRVSILNKFPTDEYWSESKETETHADGVFMEQIGSITPFFPIDVKVSQNRRTPQSTYGPTK